MKYLLGFIALIAAICGIKRAGDAQGRAKALADVQRAQDKAQRDAAVVLDEIESEASAMGPGQIADEIEKKWTGGKSNGR